MGVQCTFRLNELSFLQYLFRGEGSKMVLILLPALQRGGGKCPIPLYGSDVTALDPRPSDTSSAKVATASSFHSFPFLHSIRQETYRKYDCVLKRVSDNTEIHAAKYDPSMNFDVLQNYSHVNSFLSPCTGLRILKVNTEKSYLRLLIANSAKGSSKLR